MIVLNLVEGCPSPFSGILIREFTPTAFCYHSLLRWPQWGSWLDGGLR